MGGGRSSGGIPEGLKMIKRMLDLGVSYLDKDIDGLSPLDMGTKNSKQGGVHV